VAEALESVDKRDDDELAVGDCDEDAASAPAVEDAARCAGFDDAFAPCSAAKVCMKAAAIVEAVAFCAMGFEFVALAVARLLGADATGVDAEAGNAGPVAPGIEDDKAIDCGVAVAVAPGTEAADCEPAPPAAPAPLMSDV